MSDIDDGPLFSKPLVLEEKTRLSHSIIWTWMRNYYDQQGVQAWLSGVVPNFVTTNSHFARSYARVFVSYVRDYFAANKEADTSQPIYIVELGAGHGKFGFLVLLHLIDLREFLPAPVRVKYIMTDFTDSNIEFWKTHPKLQPFIQDGWLDFAKFDAEHDRELTLQYSNITLRKGEAAHPMIVIANYVFDTLRQEAFRIRDGQLYEALLTVISDRPSEPDIYDPGLIKRARFEWDYRLASPPFPYFSGRQADLDAVLQRLLDCPTLQTASSILVPVGGLSCLRNLAELHPKGHLMCLSGDKAYNFAAESVGLRPPHFAIHGSFSMMVNFDAIKHYVEAQDAGGAALQTPYWEGFKVSLFSVGMSLPQLPETRMAFADQFESFGPENFASLQRCLKDETPNPSLKNVLSLIRLSCHDSEIFFKFKQALIDQIALPQVTDKVLRDVRRDLDLVWRNHFPLSKAKDVAFEIARMQMGLGDYSQAINFFLESLSQCGDHHVTHFNLGICHHYVGDLVLARQSFEKSVELKPDYKEARDWLAKLEGKLRPPQTSTVSVAAALPSISSQPDQCEKPRSFLSSVSSLSSSMFSQFSSS